MGAEPGPFAGCDHARRRRDRRSRTSRRRLLSREGRPLLARPRHLSRPSPAAASPGEGSAARPPGRDRHRSHRASTGPWPATGHDMAGDEPEVGADVTAPARAGGRHANDHEALDHRRAKQHFWGHLEADRDGKARQARTAPQKRADPAGAQRPTTRHRRAGEVHRLDRVRRRPPGFYRSCAITHTTYILCAMSEVADPGVPRWSTCR